MHLQKHITEGGGGGWGDTTARSIGSQRGLTLARGHTRNCNGYTHTDPEYSCS